MDGTCESASGDAPTPLTDRALASPVPLADLAPGESMLFTLETQALAGRNARCSLRIRLRGNHASITLGRYCYERSSRRAQKGPCP